jgi:hypothetical protein
VGPRVFLDAVVKRKIPSPLRESNPREKIKFYPCLAKHHAIKTCWGSEGIAPHILNIDAIWR